MKITCYRAIRIIALFVLSASVVPVRAEEPYRNVRLSFDERVNDLTSKLTLDEKISLMRYDSPAITRLGIPAYNWWNECLHGVARSGLATVFPEAIAMAAMWDGQQMHKVATVISDEARAKYNLYQQQGKTGIYKGLTFWTPNINIFRDPRWGRGMETYGEDPYLTAEMAIPFIKGLQGDDPRYLKLVSTVKHFAVHSGPESTRHSFNVTPSDYDLAETYLPHFRRTITEAGAYSVMCAYQRLNGSPCCGSKFLENILRNQWNFSGYIVSDCAAIDDFYQKNAHHVVNTPEEAAAMAIKAGTDLNCGDTYALHLLQAVRQGLVSENEIDISVKRLLLARFKLGQFDPADQVPFSQIPYSIVDCAEHQTVALDAARKSMVLLENRNQQLPLSKSIQRIAVIGPNADNEDILLGNYNGYPSKAITPLMGIKQKLPQANVGYALGCRLASELPALTPVMSTCLFTDKSLKTKGIKGMYYSSKKFRGKCVHTRVDNDINFVWWSRAPFADMQPDSFSVRWKGVLVPPVSGRYAIGAEAFNGFDIYIDGKKFIHGRPSDHDPRREYEFIELKAGKKYDIQFDYPENNSEYAVARLKWDVPEPHLLDQAVALAAQSEAVVLCMGLSPSLEGEEMKVKVPGFDGGDRVDISLPQSQCELIAAIQKLNKPTVLVLLNGSAVSLSNEAQKIPSVLEAWYPGQSGGVAIADILFGDYNPAGRLPLTFYKNIQQISAFDDYGMAGKTYRYFSGEPQYEFGYGLSFSSFQYKIKKASDIIKPGENITISVEVTNTGTRDGDEVAQVYTALPDSKLQKTIRSLAGFERIHLRAGESKLLDFTLKPYQMAARNDQNQAVVEPGNVLISVGGKQPDKSALAEGRVLQFQVEVVGDKFFVNN